MLLITAYFDQILELFIIVMLDGLVYDTRSPYPLNKAVRRSVIIAYALNFLSHLWYLILLFAF